MAVIWTYLEVILLIWMIKDSEEIKNARLILPPIVRAGTSATLLCLYDLERAPLYSVQWYRGNFEFYRYVPNENPSYKVFSIPGIYVDSFSSNENQVTLRNIPSYISGEISCEITADAPYFSSSCVSANLNVVELDLDLKVPKRYYHLNEAIIAYCNVSPSSIETELSFHLGSRRIPDEFVSYPMPNLAKLEINATWNDFDVTEIRCSASLDDMYYVTSRAITIQLDDQFDVNYMTISSNSKGKDRYNVLMIVLFSYCNLVIC